MGLTERAARAEQVLIERAVGAARLFGSIAPDLLANPEGCQPILSRFVEANEEFSFVGVLPLSGVITCSSFDEPLDFSDYPKFEETMAAQQPTIVVNEAPPASRQSTFVISEPFDVDGNFAGFVSVSIPHKQLPETSDRLVELGLEEIITFNENGTILTARSDRETAMDELPANVDLVGLSTSQAQTFRAINRSGVERRYSIVTISGSPAAVMAIWNTDAGSAGALGTRIAPLVFPVLMWFASMGVAMLAMNTLVLRHFRRLRRSMDQFADTRRASFEREEELLTPIEIENLEVNFQRMSEEILRDEASLEDTLREKDVLVKEIHHRVKNNLQLISSIMNMQIRTARHAETKDVLQRLQERVLSLATIHRDLYQSQDGGRVNAGALITEIIEKSVELVTVDGGHVDVETDIDQVRLYPDQAVPLSLLVAEAATNAVKHIGDTKTQTPEILVRLKEDNRSCTLVMSNSIGNTIEQQSTGLGSKLMQAFAMQMGGKIDVDHSEEKYTLTLHFEALEFEPEARDY
ncbi:MAG: sensor histidine kinase [Pseudomonadota bacterium]